jgi:hypothetical protein
MQGKRRSQETPRFYPLPPSLSSPSQERHSPEGTQAVKSVSYDFFDVWLRNQKDILTIRSCTLRYASALAHFVLVRVMRDHRMTLLLRRENVLLEKQQRGRKARVHGPTHHFRLLFLTQTQPYMLSSQVTKGNIRSMFRC